MARRKRASMREGPLSDLFRSTAPEPGQPEQPEQPEQAAAQPPEPEAPPEYRPREDPLPAQAEQQQPSAPPEPEASHRVAPPRERLRKVFGPDEVPSDMLEDGPAFGRAEPDPTKVQPGGGRLRLPVLRVIGVGGAGVNAVNRMVEAQIAGVEFMAINTDLQSLQLSNADVTVHIGAEVTRGLGSGSDTNLGHRSAFEDHDKMKRLLKGSDMVFITAGAGGGTGTGAAPVVARVAREVGALTVGIVTKPFKFEGNQRYAQAEEGIARLAEEVDTLIVVPNDRLLSVLDKKTRMVDAFRVADDVLRQGVQGISDLVTLPGLINLDFAAVRTVMNAAGRAVRGIGRGSGEARAVAAAEKAISSPLLETGMEGAQAILLSITGGRDLSLVEVSEAAKVVQEVADPDADIIFGAMVDDDISDEVWVTVVATRFGGRPAARLGVGSGTRVVREEQPERRMPAFRDSLDVPEFIPGG